MSLVSYIKNLRSSKYPKKQTILLKPVFLAILLFSAFGPYIIPSIGLRLDHVVIYFGALFLTTIFFLKNHTIQVNYYIAILILIFTVLVITPLLVNIFSEYGYVSITSVMAGIENYLQPIVIIAITLFIFSDSKMENDKELFINFLKVLILLLCINTLFSLLLFYVGPGELAKAFGGAGRGDIVGLSVSERALIGGRAAGVFTQIIEGGVAYSIGLLAWFYLCRTDEIFNKSLGNNIQFCIIVIGGVLTGSKVFFILCPIISLLYLNPLMNYKIYFNLKFVLVSVVMICSFIFMVNNWNGVIPIERGFVYVTRLADIDAVHLQEDKDKISSWIEEDYDLWYSGKDDDAVTSSDVPMGMIVRNDISANNEVEVVVGKTGQDQAGKIGQEDNKLVSSSWFNDNIINNQTLNTYISVYTSGRFGNKYSISNLLSYVADKSPIYGFGFGVYINSDNSMLEVIRNAGFIGIFFYSMMFIILIYKGIIGTFNRNEDARLMLAIWVLILLSSIGAPIVTANRISIFIWMITTYTLIHSVSKTKISISTSGIKIDRALS